MNLEKLRRHCTRFPGVTEQIQWGCDLVFKVGGKMFAVAPTEPGPHVLSFKCSDEAFAELLEREGVVPAPYLARAKWVALERFDALDDREIEARVAESYRLVFAGLTKREQARIAPAVTPAPSRGAPRRKSGSPGRARRQG